MAQLFFGRYRRIEKGQLIEFAAAQTRAQRDFATTDARPCQAEPLQRGKPTVRIKCLAPRPGREMDETLANIAQSGLESR